MTDHTTPHPSQEIFFNNNPEILWMPLAMINKTPLDIDHKSYERLKRSDGTITHTPNFTEFEDNKSYTISPETLKERQTLFYDLPYRGIDTYKISQIDIDTPNVNKEWLNLLLNETPYYKSLRKPYGYHIFVKINDDFVPELTTYHFKAVFPANDEYPEYRLCPDEDEGNIEFLTGKWGYIKNTTEIFNAEKPIAPISHFKDCLVDYRKKNTIIRINEPPPPYEEVEHATAPENNDYIKNEINAHMLNINQKYIDNYHDHIKIINAILKTGYEDIARNCMFKSSNTKNKNLEKEFEKFKNSKLYDITPATLFYYSKISNKEEFFKINQKYQYYQLRTQARAFFFDLDNITKTINTQYLPKNLINPFLEKREQKPKDPFCAVLENGGEQKPKDPFCAVLENGVIIHIRSPMGTGKTSVIKDFLDKHKDESVLYISPRRTFSNDVFTDLQYCGFNHYQYLTKYKNNNNNEIPKRIICQMESIHKLKNQTYDIVIIDEIESDLSQLVSSTNKMYITNHYLLERFIKDAKIIITMDAFLTSNSQQIINKIKPNTKTYTIENTYKSKENWTAIEIGKLKELMNIALTDIEEGKKIVFISSIKKVAQKFIEKLPIGCKYKFYSGDSGDADKKFNNINEEWGNIDVLVYTGVITCGVSFDPEMAYYDSIYCYVSPAGSLARDIQQSKERVRKFKQKTLYFCVDKTSYAYDYKTFYASSYAELEKYERELMNERDKEGGSLNELPEWAFKNHMFGVYTKQTNTMFQLALFCEYLRFQGYKIIYADYSNGNILDGAKYIPSCNVYESSNLSITDYEELQKRCYDLTEQEKQKMKCYLFEMNMGDIIKTADLDTISILYKHFSGEDNMRLFNIMFRPSVYNAELEYLIEKGEQISNLTTSIDRKRYSKINELCNILGCRKIYELDYTTDTLDKKANDIMKWVDENKHFFNFRDTQGEISGKYINSVIKHISEFVGLHVEASSTCKYVNKKKVSFYKYSNYKTKKGDLVKLYEIYKGLEK